MSSEEFVEWQAYFAAEELSPENDRIHRAAHMAALHNGPMTRSVGGVFRIADFFRDPWIQEQKPTPPTAEELARQVDEINARIEQ